MKIYLKITKKHTIKIKENIKIYLKITKKYAKKRENIKIYLKFIGIVKLKKSK